MESNTSLSQEDYTIIDERPKKRPRWSNQREFFLACLGYCVGLGNVWRFPYLCYQNGGGAFLVPYTLVAVLVGMPMYFLEVATSQFMNRGPIKTYNMVPVMKGVGVGSLVICLYSAMYFIVALAWGFMYLYHSFTKGEFLWSTCDNWWNTNSCVSYVSLVSNNTNSSQLELNGSSITLSVEEFWRNYIIRQSSGIHDIGSTNNYLFVICFLISWICCYFCVFKGAKSTGKVVYFTVTFPYIILTALVIRGCTLEGAGDGIKYYLTPNFTRLADSTVWMQAGSQVLFSYGIGFAVLMAFGSYNDFHTDCFKHVALLTSTSSLTSLYAGFSVFGILGHLAHMSNKNISDVVVSGPGLAFQVYPAAFSLMPFPQLWAVLFFLMIITIGIDSEFTCVEAMMCAIGDMYPRAFRKKGSREYYTLAVCIFLAVIGIPFTFGCGIYVFELINNYPVAGASLFPMVLGEAIAFGYIYGVNKLYDDFHEMIGYKPPLYLKACFVIFVPLISVSILFFSLYQYQPLTMGNYKYPVWANVLGWTMAMSSVIMIPIFVILELTKAKGTTFQEKWRQVTSPKYADHILTKRTKDHEMKECLGSEI